MSTTENYTSGGEQPTAKRTQKKSAEKPAPSKQPSAQSSLPHKQGVQPHERPMTQADKTKAVQSIFRGEAPENSETPETPGDNSDTTPNEVSTDDAPKASPQFEAPEGDDEGADANEGAADTEQPFDVKALAEQLGTTPKKLYDSLQIALGDDGETVTLGQLKDRVKAQETAEREIVEKEQSLSQREARLLQDNQQMQMVLENLKGKIDPNVVAQIQERGQQQQARERQLFLKAMPELQDQSKMEQFRDDVVTELGNYGFKPQEINIGDHRIGVLLRDFIQTKRHLKRLMEFQPDQQPTKAAKPQRSRSKPDKAARAIENARRNGATKADQLSAVSEVLKSRRRKR